MDSVREFAKQVAPLYKYHNWLGLGHKPIEDVQNRVEQITRDLYKEALRHVGKTSRYSISTGRVIVSYETYDEDPDEITINLSMRTLIEDGDGFYDVYDERFNVES